MLIVRLFWRGEIELPVAFWWGCVILNLTILDRIGVMIVGALDSNFALRFYTSLLVVFNMYLLPGVWRSARFWLGARKWSVLARLACVALAIRVIITFVRLW